ncbi:hypothetical protein K1719_021853 [Acacia pycnantha]|nr:hypothetical protein K1719_021853 [Acacia pycnantha]
MFGAFLGLIRSRSLQQKGPSSKTLGNRKFHVARPQGVSSCALTSMEGVIDGGVGIGLKTSPRRAAIEKAQAELRREYEFEAKGSFALTIPPHGDSVDSTARPGGPSVSEPDTDADGLLILGIDNELAKGERRPLHQSRRNNVAPSEQSSKIDGSKNAKDSKDSVIFRQYARRKRSRTNHGPWGSSRDGKGLVSKTSNLKDHTSPNGDREVTPQKPHVSSNI